MSKQSGLRAIVLALSIVLAMGCGDINDDVAPTPTPGPTPTPRPGGGDCGGTGGVPGCRELSWVQNVSGDASSPTGLFASTSFVGNVGNAALTFILGSFQIAAGEVDAEGVAELRLIGPPQSETDPHVIVGMKLLLDFLCLKFDPETSSGQLYCDGRTGQGVDTRTTAGPGDFARNEPRVQTVETDLGDSAPPGSLVLQVGYQLARLSEGPGANFNACLTIPECGPGDVKDCYQPPETAVLTTGTVFGDKGGTMLQLPPVNGVPSPLGISGEPFDCSTWQVEDGEGRIALGLLDFDAAVAKETATGLRFSDN